MLEVKNLVKKYGDHIAVDHLNFTVETGKIYGFLGPNGAGKSTTMNMITGCLAATEGQVLINGHDIFEEPLKAKKCMGYLPEQPPLYLDMTAFEYLKFVGEAKGLDSSQLYPQMNAIMEQTQIADVQDRLLKNLSKGYKQRVGIAQAMLGEPEIIILDEPTVGLDPKQIIEIRDLIQSLGENRTVILSSHILSEVSAVCDYVMIIAHGKMVASDTTEKLSSYMVGTNRMTLTVKCRAEEVEKHIRFALSDIVGITEIEVEHAHEENAVQVIIHSERDADIREAVFYALSGAKCPILSMVSAAVSLEDVFLKLTGEEVNQAQTETLQEEEEAYTPLFQSSRKSTSNIEEKTEEEKNHDSDL